MNKLSEDSGSDFVLVDAIVSEAYVTSMISCLLCENHLMAADLGIDEPNEPKEIWAKVFLTAAKNAGWSVSSTGAIICPKCND